MTRLETMNIHQYNSMYLHNNPITKYVDIQQPQPRILFPTIPTPNKSPQFTEHSKLETFQR